MVSPVHEGMRRSPHSCASHLSATISDTAAAFKYRSLPLPGLPSGCLPGRPLTACCCLCRPPCHARLRGLPGAGPTALCVGTCSLVSCAPVTCMSCVYTVGESFTSVVALQRATCACMQGPGADACALMMLW